MEITQEIRGKGAQRLGRCDQPVQPRVGGDLEDPSRGADTQALSQAGQDAHEEVALGLFAVEDRAMRFQKGPLKRGTVELTPGAATGMHVGPEITKPEPSSVVTTGMRTKMPGGV